MLTTGDKGLAERERLGGKWEEERLVIGRLEE